MKTKLLFLSALFAFSFSAFAGTSVDFSGSYGGMLTVAVDSVNPTMTEDTIALNLEANGYYTLTISDFSYSGTAIGDIVVDSIQITNVNGVDTLTREGSFAGPTVMLMPTVITLEEGAIYSDESIFLSINVSVPMASLTIPVFFAGGKIVAANAETTIQNIAIVPSLASESIRVQAEAGNNYVIYSIGGSAVKSGVLNDEEIDISALASGTYFFITGRKSAKFIKK
ncbi:MAG: hypothetical protein JXQ69_02785 [Paludibacteraceae bacterium]|nr:hypothetical protein [Paludibacteraceae bacterium]MBN2787228.1 hypothetical protein [Paludibacteraceae bacterium]